MRTAIRLGLVAASLAGSASLATPATAACHGTITPPPLPHVGAAVCDSPGSVQVFPAPGGYIVCWMGHAPVQVWVASNALGIAPYDQVQVVVNRAGLDRNICTGVF